MKGYSDEGVVLARRNYGEADRVISVYTKNHGRVSLVAKAVRRPESRKRGHLEVFNLIRFQAVSSRWLDLMTEAEVRNDFREIRKNLKKVSLAYYFCEVVEKITHEGEPHLGVFNLLVENLKKLQTAKQLKSLRLGFILSLLTTLGYWPQGRALINPDEKLAEVIERQIASVRVGKRMLQ